MTDTLVQAPTLTAEHIEATRRCCTCGQQYTTTLAHWRRNLLPLCPECMKSGEMEYALAEHMEDQR